MPLCDSAFKFKVGRSTIQQEVFVMGGIQMKHNNHKSLANNLCAVDIYIVLAIRTSCCMSVQADTTYCRYILVLRLHFWVYA